MNLYTRQQEHLGIVWTFVSLVVGEMIKMIADSQAHLNELIAKQAIADTVALKESYARQIEAEQAKLSQLKEQLAQLQKNDTIMKKGSLIGAGVAVLIGIFLITRKR